MKAIMMSIRPEWVAKILNGEKTIEIRKKFPKDFVGWVYIYCTKNGNDCYGMPTDLVDYRGCAIYNKFKLMPKGEKVTTDDNQPRLNGKVVARFWCDKVEEILNNDDDTNSTKTLSEQELLKKSCLTEDELVDYLPYSLLNDKDEWVLGKAIHITKLEIFDKPKELKDYKYLCPNVLCDKCKYGDKSIDLSLPICKRQVANPPQNYYYIEVDL